MRRQSIMLDAWVALLTFLLCGPLLTRTGYPLARDLVFTPHQPMTPETLGLGSLPPRAVPLDALVWLAEKVIDGAVLARLVVPGALLVAGWGAHRLTRDLSLGARFLVAGFAVWNPYVVERLALGQWALLWCYAALWWLVAAVRSGRGGQVVGWLAIASITPTGAVIAAGTALALGRSRRVAVAALLFQLPWLLPSLLTTAAATSDPDGVAAFAARSERAGGAVLSLLGLGGVWDADSTPGSRTGLLGFVTTALMVVALVAGGRAVARRFGSSLVVVGGIGLVLAAASSIQGLDDGVRWAVETVPGAGLVRDAQKWLLPFVVVAVLCLGETADKLARRVSAGLVVPGAMLAGLLPMLLLPDGAQTTWETVTPVHYPADFQKVKEAVSEGDLASLAVLPALHLGPAAERLRPGVPVVRHHRGHIRRAPGRARKARGGERPGPGDRTAAGAGQTCRRTREGWHHLGARLPRRPRVRRTRPGRSDPGLPGELPRALPRASARSDHRTGAHFDSLGCCSRFHGPARGPGHGRGRSASTGQIGRKCYHFPKGRGRTVNKILRVVGPAVGGAALAGISMFAIVSAQVAAPSQNPANNEIITYGSR
jgi:hypothetical protein